MFKSGLIIRVVSTLTLAKGKKADHRFQMDQLGGIMDVWVQEGWYDADLDRFSQYLRVVWSGGQDALEAHLEGVVVPPGGVSAL